MDDTYFKTPLIFFSRTDPETRTALGVWLWIIPKKGRVGGGIRRKGPACPVESDSKGYWKSLLEPSAILRLWDSLSYCSLLGDTVDLPPTQ